MTLITLKGASGDCGYPSTVQLDDGTLVTAYYADKTDFHTRYHMGVVHWKLQPPAPAAARSVPNFKEGNLARAPDAFAFGTPGDYGQTIDRINDGLYGDPKGYICGTQSVFTGQCYVGILFIGGPRKFDQIAIGRDNTGGTDDRADGSYTLEYTTDNLQLGEDRDAADAAVLAASWRRVGGAEGRLRGHLTDGVENRTLRRRYRLSFPVKATAVRLILNGGKGEGVDEFELYLGPPEKNDQ